MNHPQQAWPFNPKFPQAFSFPAFGTVEWWAFARWRTYGGKAVAVPAAENSKVVEKQDWQHAWQAILADNSDVARAVPFSFSDGNYAMKHPGGWVETLLDAQRFWLVEINGWALRMVEDEFKKTTPPDRFNLWHYTEIPEGVEQCECFCRRFHAYQQARYRWHEHLLEKHCERTLGKEVLLKARNYIPKTIGHFPKTGAEARASLIGWLSKQRGFENHPLVRTLFKGDDKTAFDSERANPSSHRYPFRRTAPSRPDEMGWLILTWPIWNCFGWRWTQVGMALTLKFRSVDAKGKRRVFWSDSMKRLLKELESNRGKDNSIPGEVSIALLGKAFSNPSTKEKALLDDWKWTVQRKSRVGKTFEKLCRRAIGTELEKQIEKRPIGRGTNKKPQLWDFAQRITA